MFINKQGIKEYFRQHDKQISTKGLQAIEDSMPRLLDRIVANATHFKRIQETEVFLGMGALGGILKK